VEKLELVRVCFAHSNQGIKTLAKESLGPYELKKYKLWYDEEFLRFVEQRNLTKIEWLQDSTQSTEDNLTM
jgi:hypothetical protein